MASIARDPIGTAASLLDEFGVSVVIPHRKNCGGKCSSPWSVPDAGGGNGQRTIRSAPAAFSSMRYAVESVEAVAGARLFRLPAAARLAFREGGFALGLHAVAPLGKCAASLANSGSGP